MLGNGDIFAASDALAMMAQTGCDGVVVGRGCQGRPWLFAELTAAFQGRETPDPPDLGRGRRGGSPARRTADARSSATDRGIRDLRKHMVWYFKGFAVGSQPAGRARPGVVPGRNSTTCSAGWTLDQPFPAAAAGPRGRQGAPQRRVQLPDGWLLDPDEMVVPDRDAEVDLGGG